MSATASWMMVLALGVGSAPVEPPSVTTARQALAPQSVSKDRDGTWNAVAGFTYRSNMAAPEHAARAFLQAHGAALGVPAGLKLSGVMKTAAGTVVRFHPERSGIRVRGADVVVLVDDSGAVIMATRGHHAGNVTPAFRVSAMDAARAALGRPGAVTPVSVTAEQLAPRARRFYDAAPDGTLTPLFVFALAGLSPADAVAVSVDAQSGTVLQVRKLAVHAVPPGAARVFDPAPPANGPGTLVDVTLEHLTDQPEPGFLRGEYVDTFNCCKRYECTGGDGGCEERSCLAGNVDGGVESRVVVSFDTRGLPLPDIARACVPDTVYIDAPFCAEIPKASAADGDFIFSPRDDATLQAEEDEFAEVMAYYHVDTFQQHMRGVAEDAEFCLRSQECAAGVPSKGFHVAVNYLLPKFDQNTFQDLLCQICSIPPLGCAGGKGTEANPATLSGFMRVPNAAFIPALDDNSLPIPVGGDAFTRPYDSMVLYQGPDRDFGYDGDVIYHEFTHAVIHTVIQANGEPMGLVAPTLDRWGVHNDAGALNEGYADFFSESLTGNPVTGEYAAVGLSGETGIRNAGERWTCPESTTGEVHDDSRAWSSALWALREALTSGNEAQVRTFEKAVYSAMATLPANASFGQASVATSAALNTAFPGNQAAIDQILNDRGVMDCIRVRPLIEKVDGVFEDRTIEVLQFAGKAEAGLTNFAPGHMQFRLDLPARTRSFTLRFNARGGGIVGSIIGGEPTDNNLKLIIKTDEPIEYSYTANRANHDGVEQTVTPDDSGDVEVTVETLLGDVEETWYVGVNVLADNGVTVTEISAEAEVPAAPDAGSVEDAGTANGSDAGSAGGGGGGGDAPAQTFNCVCAEQKDALPTSVALLLGLLALRRRRR
ncbi:MAG: hypothetical protein AB2A00_36960 [Myxococcota bacterium]